jgi:hypothetical protein
LEESLQVAICLQLLVEDLEAFLQGVADFGLGSFFCVVLSFGSIPGPVVVVDDLLSIEGLGLDPGVALELGTTAETEVLAGI